MSGFPDFSGYDPTADEPAAPPSPPAPDFSAYSDDPTSTVGAGSPLGGTDTNRANTSGFADAQYGSDLQTPEQRAMDDSSWDVTETVGASKKQQLPDATDAANLNQAGTEIQTDPTNSVGANAPQTDVTARVGANAPTDDGYGPQYPSTGEAAVSAPKSGNWWDKVKGAASDVGAKLKDAIDPNQEGWLPHLEWAPNTDIKGNITSAAEPLTTTLGAADEAWNRGMAEGAIVNHKLAQGDLGGVTDWVGSLPYVATGDQMPWQPDANYQTAEVLANTKGGPLSAMLPGTAGGGDAGIYDVPVVGGVARLAKAGWDVGTDGIQPSINLDQLQQDIASGQYTEKQLLAKYPGNEAYKVLGEVLNPVNFIEPEIAGFKAGDIVDHLITAPSSRAIDALTARVREGGWTPETTEAANQILEQRGAPGNRGVMDLAAPDAARALTQARVEGTPGLGNTSTAFDTTTALYDGAAKLAQYDGLGTVGTDALKAAAREEATQIATDLSLRNTGDTGAVESYLDAMETIRQGVAADLTARTQQATDTVTQLAKGTARTAADAVPPAESRIAQVLADKARAMANGEVPRRDLVQAAQRRGIDLNRANAADMQLVRAEAARSVLASDVRAAMYDRAGAAMPGTESALHKGLAGTFNAVRGLLLAAAAPPLALQKFSDEWVRALSEGVVSVRPQDLATLQAAARYGAERNLFGAGERFKGFLDNGTIRSAAIKNDVLPPMNLTPRTSVAPYGIGDALAKTNRYREPMKPQDRLAAALGAPGRALAKWNDALIGAPTQHVILNAFYHDTRTLDRTRAAIADQAYQDVLRVAGPEEAAIARDRLATATTQRDFARVGRDIQQSTGVRVDTSPVVPEAGMARGTASGGPSTRVERNIAQSGGETPGFVRDITQGRYAAAEDLKNPLATPEDPFAYKPREDVTPQANGPRQWADTVLNGQGAGFTVPQGIRAQAREMGVPYLGESPQDFARKIRDAQPPNPKNLGSAGAGMGQPVRGTPLDQAAGDGGAGIVSRQQRGIRDDLNAMGGFGTGRTLDRYGSPKGAPRSSAQAANDAAALSERNRMDAHLNQTGALDSYYDELRASGDLKRVAAAGSAVHIEDAGAQRALAEAKTPADVARITHDLAEFDRAAREIRAIRQEMDPAYVSKSPVRETFGPGDVRPAEGSPAAIAGNSLTDRINATDWYHGSPTGNLTARDMDAFATEPLSSLFGRGVYFTDNPDVAATYSRATRLNTRNGEPTVYKAGVNARNSLDLNAPAPAEVRALWARQHPQYLGPRATALHELLANPQTTTEQLFRARADARSNPFTIADRFAARLRDELGYDSFTHVGGRYVGNREHQVLILNDPAGMTNLERRGVIQRFEPLDALAPNPRAAIEERVRQMQQERGLKPIEPSTLPRPGTDARFTPVQPEEQVLGRAAQQARGDVTAEVGAHAPATSAAPAEPLFRPLERASFTPIERIGPSTDHLIGATSPLPADAIAARRQAAGEAVIGRGAELAQAQRQAVGAGMARGYRIVGNQGDQTTLGGWMKNGIGGVTPPVLPFAPFHIHSAQFWARTFANHPGLAVATAQALSNLDDYGTLHLPNGMKVDGLIKLLTGAHLIDWAQKAVGYDQAVARQGNNNLIQRIGKDLAYNTVGNNAFVRPFEYVGDPLTALVQQHTNPLMKNGKVDSRDQYRTSGALAGTSGIAQSINDATGQHVPRGIVSGVTNPGQWIGNELRTGMSHLSGSDLTQYNPEKQMPYKASELMPALGWDAKRYSVAEGDAMTGSPTTADGKTLLDAYNRLMDRQAIGKIAPVQVGPEDGKAVYPPFDKNAPVSHNPGGSPGMADFYANKTEWPGSKGFDIAQRRTAIDMLKSDNPAVAKAADAWLNTYPDLAYEEKMRAGEGGFRQGRGVQAGSYIDKYGNPNGYYVESPQQASYQTARAQIARSTPVTPESVPFMDYNRAFLQNPDVAALAGKNPQGLTNEITGNALRTGAGLPQTQRLAQIAKEGQLQQPVGTNPDGTPFTLGDLLKQSGLYDAKGAQAAAIKAELARTNPVAAAYLAQEEAAYRASQGNNVTGNTARTPVRGAPSSSFSPHTSNARTSTARGGGPSASGAQSPQAGNDFFDFYRGLTNRADKAAVLAALDRAGVNPIGQKGVSAATYERALTVAQGALTTRRGGTPLNVAASGSPLDRVQANGQGAAGGRGMTYAQAASAIAQMERQAGIRTGGDLNGAAVPPRTSVPSATQTHTYPFPGKKPKAA